MYRIVLLAGAFAALLATAACTTDHGPTSLQYDNTGQSCSWVGPGARATYVCKQADKTDRRA